MTKVMLFPRPVHRAPAVRLEMRWEFTGGGLVCRWEEAEARWFIPASARPLRRAPKSSPRRVAARLAALKFA